MKSLDENPEDAGALSPHCPLGQAYARVEFESPAAQT
jgi:hypothetical protein